jgi:large conductance mechanosensitive channel
MADNDELGSDTPPQTELSHFDALSNTVDSFKDELASCDVDDVKETALIAVDMAADFYSEWRQFALRKNIFDVTVGLMVATALSNITKSLSTDIFMPLIISSWSGSNIEDMYLVLKQGKRKCSNCYKTLDDAAEDGAVTLNYGRFLDSIVSFLFTTLFLFIIYKSLMKLKATVEKEFQEGKGPKVAMNKSKVISPVSKPGTKI